MLEYVAPMKAAIDILATIFAANKSLETDKVFFAKNIVELDNNVTKVINDYMSMLLEFKKRLDNVSSADDVLECIDFAENRRITLLPVRCQAYELSKNNCAKPNFKVFHKYCKSMEALFDAEPDGMRGRSLSYHMMEELKRHGYTVKDSNGIRELVELCNEMERTVQDVCKVLACEYAELRLMFQV